MSYACSTFNYKNGYRQVTLLLNSSRGQSQLASQHRLKTVDEWFHQNIVQLQLKAVFLCSCCSLSENTKFRFLNFILNMSEIRCDSLTIITELPVVTLFGADPSCLSSGQREVLPDIRSLHDTFVPWGPNRNRALLHDGDLCLRSFHDQRWDSKGLTTATHRTSDYSAALNDTLSCFRLFLSLCPLRRKSVSSCSNRQQISIRICTAWQWQDRASIGISSVSTWCPNTWERTQPSSRRYEVLLQFVGISALKVYSL